MGFLVTTAEDEESALDLLEQGHYHAVSLDWHIDKQGDEAKGVDADYVLEFIQKERNNIVVIVVTRLGQEKYRNIRKGRKVWKVFDKQDYEEDRKPGKNLPTLAAELEAHGFHEIVVKHNPELLEGIAGETGEQGAATITPDRWWQELGVFPLSLQDICKFTGGITDRVVQGWGLKKRAMGPSGKAYYRIAQIRARAGDNDHNLELSDELILCAVRNLLQLYGRKVRPKISDSDWEDAVPAAYAEGLSQLRQSGGKKPGAFVKGVIQGFNDWLRDNRRQPMDLGDFDKLLPGAAEVDEDDGE